ncbi:MAG TPA: lysophospholipid acyltransferase family protein [Phycisphaerales bacterium]|nr:lysophospholipid acyltransferase family protein [Phycisphaerales bacterium]
MRNPFDVSRRWPGRNVIALMFWWTFIAWVIRSFMKLAYRLRIEGVENVPERGPIIYISNHQSHFDPPLIGSIVRDRPFSPMARDTLFKIPGLAWFMRTIGTIPLKRGGSGDKAALARALEELHAGRTVLIFPEGTRTKDGAIGEFKPGVMLLVKRGMADVVPVAIEGVYDIWPAHSSCPGVRGTMMVKIGKRFMAEELLQMDAKDALERMKREIEVMRLELREKIRKRTGGTSPRQGVADMPFWERK